LLAYKRKILEEHQNSCEKAGKFVEAEIAKQKIIQLKKIEEEKVVIDIKQRYAVEVRD
jgi:hypothetical protein